MLGGCYEKIHANKTKHLDKVDTKKNPHKLPEHTYAGGRGGKNQNRPDFEFIIKTVLQRKFEAKQLNWWIVGNIKGRNNRKTIQTPSEKTRRHNMYD